jgi:hypothetical protein
MRLLSSRRDGEEKRTIVTLPYGGITRIRFRGYVSPGGRPS